MANRPSRASAAMTSRQDDDASARRFWTWLSWGAVALVAIALTLHPVHDPDTWFHLRLGQYIMQTGSLPRIDPFSYTAGQTPYVPSGWLTAVLMAWLDNLYPESSLGPILMVTLAVMLAAGLVMWRAQRAGALFGGSIVLLIGLGLAVSRFSPRPDVWSLPCFTAMLFLLTRALPRPKNGANLAELTSPSASPPFNKTLWLLPPLIILWANLHAGVLIAIPFLLTFAAWLLFRWIKTRDRATVLAIIPVAVAMVAWICTPYGTGLIGLAQRIAAMPRVEWVMEWMPFFRTSFSLPWPAYAAFGLLALAVAAAVWLHPRRFHPLELLWIAALFVLMLYQRRQVGLAGLGVAMLLAPHVRETWDLVRDSAHNFWQKAAIPGLAALLIIIQISGANGNGGGWPTYGRNCTDLPCYVTDFLKANKPPGHIFNSYNFGGYLLNLLWPDTRVYIDGRLDTYPAPVWLDMLALEENRLSIDDFVKKYGVKTFVVIVKKSFGDDLHLTNRLAHRPDYALVYLDDLAAVFVHKDSETDAYVKKFGYGALHPWDLKQQTLAIAKPESQNQVVSETGRLLEQAPASAAVHGLAGFVAWAAGDLRMSGQQLQTAREINPDNELLGLVNARLAAARVALNRRK